MDKEIGHFIRDLENMDSVKKKTGRFAKNAPKNLAGDELNTGVASELTGVMPASLQHGDEIEEYQDLFRTIKSEEKRL